MDNDDDKNMNEHFDGCAENDVEWKKIGSNEIGTIFVGNCSDRFDCRCAKIPKK